MRVQDVHGKWYEVEDAILAQFELKVDSPAETPPASPEARPGAPTADSTPSQENADPS